jgi:hypothetical protein
MTVRELIVKLKAAAELVGDEAEVRAPYSAGTMPGYGPYHILKVTVDREQVVDLHLGPWRQP